MNMDWRELIFCVCVFSLRFQLTENFTEFEKN